MEQEQVFMLIFVKQQDIFYMLANLPAVLRGRLLPPPLPQTLKYVRKGWRLLPEIQKNVLHKTNFGMVDPNWQRNDC